MRKLAALLCSAALVACEPVSEPGVGPLPPQLGHDIPHPDRGSVSSSVVGGGQVLVDDLRRNFSFDALDQRESEELATVVGQFEMFDPETDERVHGIITCFLIFGDNANEAVIGGQVFLPNFVVLELGFHVVDNRPPGTTPDQMSSLITHEDNDAASAFCEDETPDLQLMDIERGDIRVFDNPPQ